MTSKKMVGSYYCLIWIGVIQCLQVSYVSEKQNKTKKQTKNKTKQNIQCTSVQIYSEHVQ